jgi:hypothetical protein
MDEELTHIDTVVAALILCVDQFLVGSHVVLGELVVA